MFEDNPFNFMNAWGALPEQPPSPPIVPQSQPLVDAQGTPRDMSTPFAFNDPNTGTADPVKALATHLAGKGVTPQQFMKDPTVAQPTPPEPSLGDSLVPLPKPAPVPNFAAGSPAPVQNVENGMATAPQPRGIRNNNPLNIEDGPFARSMPGYKGGDGRFAQFESPEHGKAAASALLDTYQNKYGLNTVQGIVNRWAPAGDGNNDPTAYAASVAKKLGIDPNAPIPPEKRQALIEAMAAQENGTGGGAPGATTEASAKTATTPTNPNAPTSSLGKRLTSALSGVKAPPAPVGQKVTTPAVPHSASTVKGGNMAALLASLVPQQGGPNVAPLYLSKVLGGR